MKTLFGTIAATAIATVLILPLAALTADAKQGRGKRRAAVAPVVTLAEVTTTTTIPAGVGAEQHEKLCSDGVWDSIGVDDDNPNGCQYFCVTAEGAGLTFETPYGCP